MNANECCARRGTGESIPSLTGVGARCFERLDSTPMRVLLLLFALDASSASATDKPAFTERDAVGAVAAGMCGSLPVGTGLVGGRGWIHQPIPGPVLLRMSGGGTLSTIGQPTKRSITLDMYAGRLSYIQTQDTPPGSRLEWKVPGHAWGAVPVGFQLPPSNPK